MIGPLWMRTCSAIVAMLYVRGCETSAVTGARWLRHRDRGPQDVSEARFARIISLARGGHQGQPGRVVGARDKRSHGGTCETAERFASLGGRLAHACHQHEVVEGRERSEERRVGKE